VVSFAATYFLKMNSTEVLLIHKIPLHNIKVCKWCAMNAKQITWSISYTGTIYSDRYMQLILKKFFTQLTEEERLYAWFKPYSAAAHTAGDSLAPLEGVW
jgi:hypothetical protein